MVKQIASTFTITIKKQADSYTIEASGSQPGFQVAPEPSPQLKNLLFDEQIKTTLSVLATGTGTLSIKSKTQLLEDIKKFSPETIENLSDEELKNLSNDDLIDRAINDAIQKLGQTLYNALFISPILLAFDKAQDSARAGTGLRLRLRIEPPELAALPWETLYDGQHWLSDQSHKPLVRQLILAPGSKTPKKLQVQGALRILFVGASPQAEGLPNLKIEKTASKLKELLEEHIKNKKIVFDVLVNATPAKLQQKMLLKDYHILYFAGHGSQKEIFLDDGQGKPDLSLLQLILRSCSERVSLIMSFVLCVEGIKRERGGKQPFSAEDLAEALEEGKPTRLVFLAACKTSAAPYESGLLAGFAQKLAKQSNLPAIVAMQYSISNMPANDLTSQFFAALAAEWPVDVALAEARKVLIRQGVVGRDVFSPVLYLQAEDGALFPKAKNWPVIVRNLVIGILLVSISWLGLRIFSTYQINRMMASSEALFTSNNQLEALSESIRAGKQANNRFFIWIDADTRLRVAMMLQNMMHKVNEFNRLDGHRVWGISFSSKDGLIALVGEDNTVKLWQPDGTIRTLKGHNWSVTSVSFSPNGELLASASKDNTVKLWKPDGTLVRTLEGYNNWVNDVSFSPDGQLIASADNDGKVKLWKPDGTLVRTLEGHSRWVLSISFSPDGQLIASASGDNTVKLWKPDGTLVRTLEGHNNWVNDVSFSPNGKLLASASKDNTIKLWKPDGTLVRTIEGHSAGIFGISFSPDGQLLASVGDDHMVKLWKLDDGKLVRTLQGHNASVSAVSFSPDGQLLASASFLDNTVRLWKLKGKFKILEGHTNWVNSVSFSPNGQLIATASDDSTVKLWKSDNGKLVRTLQGHGDYSVKSVSFSSDGRFIASASDDNTIKLWKPDGTLVHTLEGHSNFVSSVSFQPKGQLLASASWDNTVKLWNVDDGTLVCTIQEPNDGVKLPSSQIEGYNDGVRDVSFSPDGQLIASASQENKIRLWKPDCTPKGTLPGHKLTLWSISFKPKGQLIASASSDYTVKLWKLDGTEVRTLEGHRGLVRDVSYSPNGKLIASASYDNDPCYGDIKLWKSNDGFRLGTLQGHNREVRSISFSPDGKTLASASYDGTVILWRLALNDPLERSCNWVRDYLKNPSVSERYKHICDVKKIVG
jgi:WD40 repeat protein/CHAT domain-containing protein